MNTPEYEDIVISSLRFGESLDDMQLVYFDKTTDKYSIIHLSNDRALEYTKMVEDMIMDDVIKDIGYADWEEAQEYAHYAIEPLDTDEPDYDEPPFDSARRLNQSLGFYD